MPLWQNSYLQFSEVKDGVSKGKALWGGRGYRGKKKGEGPGGCMVFGKPQVSRIHFLWAFFGSKARNKNGLVGKRRLRRGERGGDQRGGRKSL